MQHIHITGIPGSTEFPIWECTYVVWPIHEILPDSRFRSFIVGNTYTDYLAILSVSEALELNEKYLDWDLEHWRKKNEELKGLLLKHRSSHPFVYIRIVDEDSWD